LKVDALMRHADGNLFFSHHTNATDVAIVPLPIPAAFVLTMLTPV
jgi:hypothetical protein